MDGNRPVADWIAIIQKTIATADSVRVRDFIITTEVPKPTAAAGWLIYSERLDMFTVLGAVLILSGNLLNLRPSPAPVARLGTETSLKPDRLST